MSSETVEELVARFEAWAPDNLARAGADPSHDPIRATLKEKGLDADDTVARAKAIQGALYGAGFAGITFPVEYGGRGLELEHLRALTRVMAPYDTSPLALYTIGIGMTAPTLLDFASEDQKKRYIPRLLSGEAICVAFMSEPTGGSDLAGMVTRADRDGDEYVVNGAKIWTSQGDIGDIGILWARTNWDVPKHAGITTFMVEIPSEGLEIRPIRLVSGLTGFCEDFFTDVRVPAENVIGDLDDGWKIATGFLAHERNAVGGGSKYFISSLGAPSQRRPGRGGDELVELARSRGRTDDSHTRQLVAEAHVLSKVAAQVGQRVGEGASTGALPVAAASIAKLFSSTSSERRADIGMELAGASAVVDGEPGRDGLSRGVGYLSRQQVSIMSGTSEIQKNIISERILGLPREPSPDRELPFREVRHNRPDTG